MSAIPHTGLAIPSALIFIAVAILLSVRSRNVDEGRGMVVVAAFLIGLHGILDLVLRVLRLLYPAPVLTPGEAPPAGPALQTFTYQVAQPLWRYLGPVLLLLGLLSLLIALILAGAARRAALTGARVPHRRPRPPVPPRRQTPQGHQKSQGYVMPDPPQRRPGSHRRPEPSGREPLPPQAEPPRPRGRHHAPGPPDDPPHPH